MSAKKDTLEKQLHLRHRPGPDNPNCFGIKTRFSSIESQPKKVVVVVVVVYCYSFCCYCYYSKFIQNCVSYS